MRRLMGIAGTREGGALLAVFVYEKAYAALPGAAAPSAAAAPPQQEARTEPTAA